MRDPVGLSLERRWICERVLGELQACPRGDCLVSDSISGLVLGRREKIAFISYSDWKS